MHTCRAYTKKVKLPFEKVVLLYTPSVYAARMQTHIHLWPTDVGIAEEVGRGARRALHEPSTEIYAKRGRQLLD